MNLFYSDQLRLFILQFALRLSILAQVFFILMFYNGCDNQTELTFSNSVNYLVLLIDIELVIVKGSSFE